MHQANPWEFLEPKLEAIAKVKNPVLKQYEILLLSQKEKIEPIECQKLFNSYVQYTKRQAYWEWWKSKISFSKIVRSPFMIIRLAFLSMEICLESLAQVLHEMDIFRVIEYVGKGALLITLTLGGITYIRETPERREEKLRAEEIVENETQKRIYEAWQVVNSSIGIRANSGRSRALEDLVSQEESLAGLDLRSIILDGVNLDSADLHQSNLESARILNSDLSNTDLSESNLQNLTIRHSSLKLADMRSADLRSTSFHASDLTGANLMGADLSTAAGLDSTNLRNVLYDKATKFPDGFQPEPKRMQKISSYVDIIEENFDFSYINLTGANLRGVDLRTAYFNSAILESAILSTTDFRDVDLSYVNLHKAKLIGSQLRNANLYRADLRGANLSYADLRGTNLQGANLLGANLNNIRIDETTNFGGSVFDSQTTSNLELARLGAYLVAEETNLSSAQLYDTNLLEAELSRTCLTGADFSRAYLPFTNFDKSDLRFTMFSSATLSSAFFENANLEGANFSNALLDGVSFYNANLRNADLSNSSLEGASLSSSTLLDGTDFSETSLKDTYIGYADFRKARGLTLQQVKQAQSWQTALYNRKLSRQLALEYQSMNREAFASDYSDTREFTCEG